MSLSSMLSFNLCWMANFDMTFYERRYFFVLFACPVINAYAHFLVLYCVFFCCSLTREHAIECCRPVRFTRDECCVVDSSCRSDV